VKPNRKRIVAALKSLVVGDAGDIIDQITDDTCTDHESLYWEELWDQYKDSGDWDSIEDFAADDSNIDDCLDDMGDTANFFEDPKKLAKSTWLVHFTNSEPTEILTKGFNGAAIEHLGLTKGGGKRLEGSYALAYQRDKVQDLGPEYGSNVILFQAGVAVEAYHKGDDEDQVIFDVRTVKKAKGFKKVGDNYETYNSTGKHTGTRPFDKDSLK